MDGRDDLSEEVSRLAVTEATPLTDVVVQLALAGVLHHDHNLVLVLEHWRAHANGGGGEGERERESLFSHYSFAISVHIYCLYWYCLSLSYCCSVVFVLFCDAVACMERTKLNS